MKEAVENTCEKIQEGKSIAGPLMRGFLQPIGGTDGGCRGESVTAGDAESCFRFYEEEVATMAKGLTSVIEPLLIIIVLCCWIYVFLCIFPFSLWLLQ